MGKTIKKIESVAGHCDYLSGNHNIDVTYDKINMLGDSTSYAKATSFSCDYAYDCNLDYNCPIFQKALKKERW